MAMQKLFDLSGNVALVTAGNGRFGSGIALELANAAAASESKPYIALTVETVCKTSAFSASSLSTPSRLSSTSAAV